jgi:glycosyltransferase involved in cell wall biosynthesis
VLWVSPLPPTASGVSDHAVELLAELVDLAPVRVLSPPDWEPPDDLPEVVRGRLVPTMTDPAPGEVPVAHLGNNPHHSWILGRLERWTGAVVVLHDLVLHHLLVETTLAVGDAASYEVAIARAHPEGGEAIARARSAGFAGRLDPFLFPARRQLPDTLRGALVHSEWAAAVVAADLPDLSVARIRLAVAGPAGDVDRMQERQRLGIADDEVVLMHLGFLTPQKGLDTVLAGLSAARAAGVPARLVTVGSQASEGGLEAAVDACGLGGAVATAGWLPTEAMRRAPAAADLGVVIRTPSAGETSAAAARFLACGTPVAVGGRRQFLELPEEAAPRLTPGPAAAADLARALVRVAEDRGGEHERVRRRAARAAWSRLHRPDLAAQDLLAALSAWA